MPLHIWKGTLGTLGTFETFLEHRLKPSLASDKLESPVASVMESAVPRSKHYHRSYDAPDFDPCHLQAF
jgi:hypothetical protein